MLSRNPPKKKHPQPALGASPKEVTRGVPGESPRTGRKVGARPPPQGLWSPSRPLRAGYLQVGEPGPGSWAPAPSSSLPPRRSRPGSPQSGGNSTSPELREEGGGGIRSERNFSPVRQPVAARRPAWDRLRPPRPGLWAGPTWRGGAWPNLRGGACPTLPGAGTCILIRMKPSLSGRDQTCWVEPTKISGARSSYWGGANLPGKKGQPGLLGRGQIF